MIEVGFKFKVHWAYHEASYKNNVYEVIDILKDCECPNPIYGSEQSSRQKHIHLTCRCVEGPPHLTEGDNRYWFNAYDYNTLRSIKDPENDYLEIVGRKPVQLNLF